MIFRFAAGGVALVATMILTLALGAALVTYVLNVAHVSVDTWKNVYETLFQPFSQALLTAINALFQGLADGTRAIFDAVATGVAGIPPLFWAGVILLLIVLAVLLR